MPLQFRRGKFGDYDESKLIAGEPCITTDSSQFFLCFSPENVKEIATVEKLQTLISESTEGMLALEQLISYLSSESVAEGILSSISTLSDNKLDKNGNSFLCTSSFATASTESNIVSGEKHEIIFGKLLKSQIDFRDSIENNISNIGTMSELNTANTSSLVNSINSVKAAIDTTNSNLAETITPVSFTRVSGDVIKSANSKRLILDTVTSSMTSGTAYSLGTLAVELRPTSRFVKYVIMAASTTTNLGARLIIEENGEVILTPYADRSVGANFFIDETYI